MRNSPVCWGWEQGMRPMCSARGLEDARTQAPMVVLMLLRSSDIRWYHRKCLWPAFGSAKHRWQLLFMGAVGVYLLTAGSRVPRVHSGLHGVKTT